MRLIDADKLDKTIARMIDVPGDGDYYVGYEGALCTVRDLIADMSTVPAYGQWIRVEDEKPDTGQYVLVNHKDGVMQCAQYLISGYDDRELWVLDHYYKEQGEITHWMPLPEPPEEVRDDGAHIEP